MTRIVCISDTHGYEGAPQLLEPSDVLIHAGDFTGSGTIQEIAKFNNWLNSLDIATKIVIPGNHDLLFEKDWTHAVSLLTAADFVLNQSGTSIGNGLLVYGEQRQPEFNNWAFNVPRDKMKYVWERAPQDTDILVTHGPPYGVGDKTLDGDHAGCKYQRQWIEEHQPRLVVCGHIHEGHGIYSIGRTVVINAAICTRQYKPTNRPIHIEVL